MTKSFMVTNFGLLIESLKHKSSFIFKYGPIKTIFLMKDQLASY